MADDAFEFLSDLAATMRNGSSPTVRVKSCTDSEQDRRAVQRSSQKPASEGTVETLRRNFRNSSAGYLVAQAVFERSPDLDAIPEWIAKHPSRRRAEDTIGNARSRGHPDGARRRSARGHPDFAAPGGDWRQAKLHGYVAIFNAALEKLASEGKRRDLAILCARGDGKSSEAQWAREALGVARRASTRPDRRSCTRCRRPEDHVRLATIHSSRGVEASRVIILDFANGVSSSELHTRNSRIMSHIALSRGQIGTTIIAVDGSTNPHLMFIEELVRAYKTEG